ncbi:hypothetical protein BASA60_001258 [Batrachochytrium salamandrivorans]|nr:hypothetical protein BASA60_001258 [Batrachochytrium salamandrivorans]
MPTTNTAFEDDSHSNPTLTLTLERAPTDSHAYGPNQGDADKNGRGNVYTGLDSGQGRLSFADALGDSPSQVLGHIKNGLSRKKKDLELSFSKQKAAAASRGVRLCFIEDLGISDGGHIKDLDRHIKALEAYKRRFSDYFSRIKEMVEDPIKTSKQRGTSKSSSSTLESKGRPDIEENPSDDGASGSAQLKSEASGGAPSTKCRGS